MKALVLQDNQLQLIEKPRPVPTADQVLIRVKWAGICNTDLEITRGYLGFNGVLGHEFMGIVNEDPAGQLQGQRVTGSINLPCGSCDACRQGRDNHCLKIKVIGIKARDGAFAEYMTLPRANIHRLPAEISDQEAVFIEPLAAGIEIVEKNHLKPTDRILVLGDGKLGLLTALALWAMGYHIHLAGKHQHKLKIVRELEIPTFNAETISGSFDVVIDCTGSVSGLEMALDLVRAEGKIILKTTINKPIALDISKAAVNEITISGSRCGPFEPALRLLRRNKLPITALIDRVYPLEQGVKAFARASEKGVLKVLLKIF